MRPDPPSGKGPYDPLCSHSRLFYPQHFNSEPMKNSRPQARENPMERRESLLILPLIGRVYGVTCLNQSQHETLPTYLNNR